MRLMSLEKIVEFDGPSIEVELGGFTEFAIFRAVKVEGKYIPDLDNYPWCASSDFVSKSHLLSIISADMATIQEKLVEVGK